MIVTSVQIKTVKTQKHLYCPVFTNIGKPYKSTFFWFIGLSFFIQINLKPLFV